MSTIKEVADLAGVSQATVSNCYNKKSKVRPETKSRVMESAKLLNYIPNIAAKNLRLKNMKTIGVLLTLPEWNMNSSLLKSFFTYWHDLDYDVKLAYSYNLLNLEARELMNFIGSNVSGLIIQLAGKCDEKIMGLIAESNIPTIFLNRCEAFGKSRYVCFDDRKTAQNIARYLLDNEFENITLFTGSGQLSSEIEFIEGLNSEICSAQKSAVTCNIIQTDFSTEDSFRKCIHHLSKQAIQVIITTSDTITSGIFEACNMLGQTPGKDIRIISVAVESWCRSRDLPGVQYVYRDANVFGNTISQTLYRLLFPETSGTISNTIILDALPEEFFENPKVPAVSASTESKSSRYDLSLSDNAQNENCEISLMLGKLESPQNLESLLAAFKLKTGIKVNCVFVEQNDLLESIIRDVESPRAACDVYMFDIPWMNTLGELNILHNLDSFYQKHPQYLNLLNPTNLQNCRYKEQYFGVPFISGAQLMFYRSDLINDIAISKEYRKRYDATLRAPLSWPEFIKAGKFFTQKFNPNSPTEFGATFAGLNSEVLHPEILIRLWGFNSKFLCENQNLSLNTTACHNAFNNLVQTLDIISKSPFEQSIENGIEEFSQGRTAFLITYTEYATRIIDHADFNSENIGFTAVPGNRPISLGWNLGIRKTSAKTENCIQLLEWLFEKDTRYKMAITDGQSPYIDFSYHHELVQLHPWLREVDSYFKHCRNRIPPVNIHNKAIPLNLVTEILCHAFYKIVIEGVTVPIALADAQSKIDRLVKG